jgi:hypothetical protein
MEGIFPVETAEKVHRPDKTPGSACNCKLFLTLLSGADLRDYLPGIQGRGRLLYPPDNWLHN